MLGKRAIDPWALDVKACRRTVTAKLRELPAPRNMDPQARMAANIIVSACRQCGRCERGL